MTGARPSTAPALRSNGPALGRRARLRRGAAAARLGRAEPAAYNLLCRYLALLDDRPGPRGAGLETALSFRLKLALAAGFSPELACCASCGEAEHLAAFSGAAGGVVCASCERGAFPLTEEAHRFMVEALARPLSEAPAAEPRRCPGRAGDHRDAEHHAHVQLRAAA